MSSNAPPPIRQLGNQLLPLFLPLEHPLAIAFPAQREVSVQVTMNSYDNNRFGIDDRRRGGGGRRADERRKAELARRRSPRMRTLKGAQIIVPAGTSIRCTVRNISETGACLQLQTPVFLSHTFDIAFDDLEWSRRSCRVVWRDALLIGVEFTTPESEGGPIRRALQRLLSGGRG